MAKEKMKSFLFETEVSVQSEKKELQRIPIVAPNLDSAKEKCESLLEQNGGNYSSLNKVCSPLPAIIALGITLFMSFFKYFDAHNYIQLFPNIISVFLSLIIYGAVVIKAKGLDNTFRSKSDTILSLLFILVLAIFINIFVGDSTTPTGIIGKFLNKIGIGNNWLLIIGAIILSWLGINQIAGFVWIAVVLMGVLELGTCGKYMGNFKGAIFLLSTFVGFVFYLKYEGKIIINSFKNNSVVVFDKVVADVNKSQICANTTVKNVTETIKEKKSQRKTKKIMEDKNEK